MRAVKAWLSRDHQLSCIGSLQTNSVYYRGMYLNYYSTSTLIYTLLNFCIYLHPHVTIVWREEIHIYKKKDKIISTWRQAREHGLRVPCSPVENHRRWGGWKNIRMIGKWDVTETLVLFVLHKKNLYVLMLSHLVKLDL